MISPIPYKPLTPEEKYVIIDKGTEAPNTGQLIHESRQGLYICRQCKNPLYRSNMKFDSHCGRPAFDDAIPGQISMVPDTDNIRTEIVCKNCGGHLGHVFHGEQLTQKNLRHCVNSISMKFIPNDQIDSTIKKNIPVYQSIVLGGGCFRCIEGPMALLDGVIEVRSGYAGGKRPYPTYERICTGVSGFIEVVEVFYNPAIILLDQIFGTFFALHDPTSLDLQGGDKGPQYRSVILYKSDDEREKAQKYIDDLTQQEIFDKKIVTQIMPLDVFYTAEPYHQNFYKNNPNKPYCQMVVAKKIAIVQKRQSTNI